jgi:hypothetical protein
VLMPANGMSIPYDGHVVIAWEGVPKNLGMLLTVVQHGGKGGLRLSVPFDGGGLLPVAMDRLPTGGQYDWNAWVVHPTLGNICAKSGNFVVGPKGIF